MSQIIDDISRIVSTNSKNDDFEIICNPQELVNLQKENEQLKEKLVASEKLIEEKETINIEQEKKIKQLTEDLHQLNELSSTLKAQVEEFKSKSQECELKNAEIRLQLEAALKNSTKQQEKANQYEEELKKLQKLIDTSSQQMQEQNRLNQSLIRKNNDIVNQQQKREEELKKKDENKLMFSSIQQVNSIFQQVEEYKSQLLTYEELFKNLDFPTFWDILSSRVNEKVDKHAGNKTEYRASQFKHETIQICEGLQQALVTYKINFKFEL